MAGRVKKLLRGGGGGGGGPSPPSEKNGDRRNQSQQQQRPEQREDQPANGGRSGGAESDGGWRTGVRRRIGRGRSRDAASRSRDAASRQQQQQQQQQLAKDASAPDPATDGANRATSIADPQAPPADVAAAAVPGRSVKFADEGSVEMPLTTTKLIQNGTAGTSRSASSAASAASASSGTSSVSGSTTSTSRRQPAGPGEGYVGTPPPSNAEAKQHWRRVLVMLLSPKHTQYEIVAIFYDVRVRAGLSEVLREVSRAATSPRFSRRRYNKALTRAQGAEAGVEMISALSLKEYDVQADEVLVAIPRGYTGKQVAPMAASLLSNERVRKLMNRIVKRSKAEPSPSHTSSRSMYGKATRLFTKSKRRIKRRMRKASSGAKVLCSLVTILVLFAWLYYFASPYLPDDVRDMIDGGVGKAEALGYRLSGRINGRE